MFRCKDKERAEHVVSETAKVAEKLQHKFPKVRTKLFSPTHIVACAHSEKQGERACVELDFSPYNKKGFWDKKIFDNSPKGFQDGWVTHGDTATSASGPLVHILACELLEPARKLSNKSLVEDDAEYCGDGDTRDTGKLIERHESFNKFLEAVESEIGGFNDS